MGESVGASRWGWAERRFTGGASDLQRRHELCILRAVGLIYMPEHNDTVRQKACVDSIHGWIDARRKMQSTPEQGHDDFGDETLSTCDTRVRKALAGGTTWKAHKKTERAPLHSRPASMERKLSVSTSSLRHTCMMAKACILPPPPIR